MKDSTTHFGFRRVPVSEKARRVRGVFDSVADRYDLMNDLMSAGLHRLWKRLAVQTSNVRAGRRVLDLAGGTGDLAWLFAERVGERGRVVLCDINRAMLDRGRSRLIDRGASLEDVIAAKPTAEWDEAKGDPARLLDRAYDSLTRH